MEFIKIEDFEPNKWPMYFVDVEISIKTSRRDKNGKIILIKKQFDKIIVKGSEKEVYRRLRSKIDKLIKGRKKNKSYEISNITLIRSLGWGVAE